MPPNARNFGAGIRVAATISAFCSSELSQALRLTSSSSSRCIAPHMPPNVVAPRCKNTRPRLTSETRLEGVGLICTANSYLSIRVTMQWRLPFNEAHRWIASYGPRPLLSALLEAPWLSAPSSCAERLTIPDRPMDSSAKVGRSPLRNGPPELAALTVARLVHSRRRHWGPLRRDCGCASKPVFYQKPPLCRPEERPFRRRRSASRR